MSGPCLICGAANNEHRTWDAIDGRVRAGERVADVARDYGVSRAYVRRIVERHARARKQHRALPGRKAEE